MNDQQKLEHEETQLEIFRTRVTNCKSPSSFDGLYDKFLCQEIVVNELKEKVDEILDSNE